jgi:glutamate/tyrosine decarboxylase-like PLP-dependent enzyme
MVDDMLDYQKNVRERPVWQPVPENVQAYFEEPLPEAPQPAEEMYREFVEYVLPYPTGNNHPRFWGWALGNGTVLGMLAEMLAAAMNPNVGGPEQSANYVETQVLSWLKDMMGYPANASGLLVSGGSMANLVGLTVARNAKAEFDLRRDGVGAAPRKMVLYASQEVHSSVQRGIELLGLGSDALRYVPANDAYQIDLAALEEAIADDKAAGHYPFCVVGCAGTINTGALDDLNALADICEREGLWFHVDGAFGAWAAISPELRPLVAGMERADSLAFDLHKWGYLPYEVGCTFVRSDEQHRRTFSLIPDYLSHATRGVASASRWYSDYGVQLSRGFRALKVWMELKTHGAETFRHLIRQNVEQARYLSELVDAAPELEPMAPVMLNVVAFRYRADHLDDPALDALNEELIYRLHESGVAVPSGTTLNGRYAIRACVTNHRSRRDDFDLFVRELVRLGDQLANEG